MIRINNKNIPIGFNSIQFYTWLVSKQKKIQKINVLKFQKPPKLQDRLMLNDIEVRIITIARLKYEISEMSFWDIIFSVCVENGISSGRLFEQATFHQKVNYSPLVLTRSEVKESKFHELTRNNNEGQVVAISSEVLTVEGIKHIPMMDFHCSISTHNLIIVKSICDNLFKSKSFILETDRSYHACGMDLLSFDDWLEFMARSLLFGNVVDRAYVAHQLIERKGCLRISKGKKGKMPILVETT